MIRPLDVMGALVLDTGQEWALAALPHQLADARAVLAEEPKHRRHYHGAPRAWGKTTNAGGYTTAGLLGGLIPPGERGYCCAADRDQAALLVQSIAGFVARTPGLGSELHVETFKVTARATGASVIVLASDAASAHGLRSRWWVLDELGAWDDVPSSVRFFEAISTSWPKDNASRVVVISTAGRPGGFAHGVYRHVLQDPLWRVSEVHEPPPWVDATEMKSEIRRLPTSAYLRYWRNEWAQGEDKLLEPEDIAACTVLSGPVDYKRGKAYCLGVDLALRNDNAVVLTGHRDGYGSEACISVDRLDVFTPRKGRDVDLQKVEALIEARSRQYGGAPVVFDPAQAWQMMGRLRSRGVRVIEHTFSASSNSMRTLRLLELVRSHRLRLPDDDELVTELVSLRVRELGPGQFRYDHPVGGHDDRVTSLSLVALHLMQHSAGPGIVRPPTGRTLAKPKPSARSRGTPGPRLVFGDGSTRPIRRGSVQHKIGRWR